MNLGWHKTVVGVVQLLPHGSLLEMMRRRVQLSGFQWMEKR